MRIRSLKYIVFVSFFLLQSHCVADDNVELRLRWEGLQSQDNLLAPGFIIQKPLSELWTLRVGSQYGITKNRLDRVNSKGEIAFHWGILHSSFELQQAYLFTERTPSTTFLFTLGLRGEWGDFHPFANLGWYKRYTSLNTRFPFSFPGSHSFSDHDIAMQLGVRYTPSSQLISSLWIGTYDTLEVFRLNNPYFAGSVEYKMENRSRVHLQLRYRILLGFGRLEGLALTAGWILPLSDPPPMAITESQPSDS